MNIVYTRGSTIYDDSRATKEIIALVEQGFHVTVLGWDRNGKSYTQCKNVFDKYISNINFAFFKWKIGDTVIKKIIARIKWNRWLRKQLVSIKDVDIVHACDCDSGATVRRYAKKKSVKFVYDIFDYYVDAHVVPKFLRGVIEKEEISIINDADLTIICTEERREQIKKANPKRVVVIHNSPDVDNAYDFCNEIYDYAYCGSMFDGRLIEEILDEYRNHSKYSFLFAGYGNYEDKAKEYDSKYNNFKFVGSIPYSKVLEYESKSRIISAIYKPTIRNHQLCAPNKFYEALALAKPLIVCRGTGIDRIVERNGIGIVIDYDAKQFYDAINKLVSDSSMRNQMGKKARKLYDEEYRWSIMKDRLVGEYNVLLRRN